MNLDKVLTDYRGNRWIQTSVKKSDQNFLNTVRKNWTEVSDDDIFKAKKIVLNAFKDNASVRGSPYIDFIHMFNSENNYFIQTNIYKEPTVLKYEGECDMHLSYNTTYEELLQFI